MKKNVFAAKAYTEDEQEMGYEYRRPVSDFYKGEGTGSLHAYVGDYTKQRDFEKMLRETKTTAVNRFFELIPNYTLRENLLRSGRSSAAVEQIAEELELSDKLDEATLHLGALEQEKAAIALAVLKRPGSLGFVNTPEGLSSGEKICYYDAVESMCRKYNIKGLIFTTRYKSFAETKPLISAAGHDASHKFHLLHVPA